MELYDLFCRRRAGTRRLRRRLVLVGGDRAAAERGPDRHRRAEPADLPRRRRGAYAAHPGPVRGPGDPGRPFVRRDRDHRDRDRPARGGPGLYRGSRPDAGEDYAALAGKFPAPPANAGLVYDRRVRGAHRGRVPERLRQRRRPGSGPACSTRCRDASRSRSSTTGPRWRPGGQSRPGTDLSGGAKALWFIPTIPLIGSWST